MFSIDYTTEWTLSLLSGIVITFISRRLNLGYIKKSI